MGLYLTTLVTQIARTYAGTTKAETRVRVEGVILDISRATPVGLIVNELVTNSFKYGFPAGFDCQQERGSGCTIIVSLVSEGGDAILTVSDNGIGMPAGIDPLKIRSLGFRLITFLARYQLQGAVAVEAQNGTAITIRFPDKPRTPA
jgi:two-component sensor histidine kinase